MSLLGKIGKIILPLAKKAAKKAAMKELDKKTGGLASEVEKIAKDL